MKKIIYILFLLAAIVGQSGAQKIVSIDYVSDSLTLVYELPMEKVKSDYQLTINPAICGPNDTIRLSPIHLQGDNYIRQAHRDFVLNAPKGSVEQRYNRAKDMPSHLRDTLQLPINGYEWLLLDTICMCYVEREQTGCCTVKQLGEHCGRAYAFAEPVIIPMQPVDTNVLIISADTAKTDTVPQLHRRLLPKSIEGMAVQKQIPEVIKHINSGVLRSLEDYRPYTTTEILAKDSDALLVYFELDKVELKPDYRDNQIILDSILYLVDELMNDTTVEIKLVQIVGLASVEGPLERNQWLAGSRAKALERYIRDRHPEMTDRMFESANGGEGWTEFEYAVENSNFEGKEQVLQIIHTFSDVNVREQRIKELNGGNTYKYMLENILLNQRNSGYIRIYYDVTDDEARIINKAIRAMQDGDNALALEMLRVVKKDPRSWNSLGVALWLNGEHAEDEFEKQQMRGEAIEWFRRAAERGDKEAQRNLEGLGEKR